MEVLSYWSIGVNPVEIFLNVKAHPAGLPSRMSFWFGQDPSVHISCAEGEGEVRNFSVGKFGRFVGKEER